MATACTAPSTPWSRADSPAGRPTVPATRPRSAAGPRRPVRPMSICPPTRCAAPAPGSAIATTSAPAGAVTVRTAGGPASCAAPALAPATSRSAATSAQQTARPIPSRPRVPSAVPPAASATTFKGRTWATTNGEVTERGANFYLGGTKHAGREVDLANPTLIPADAVGAFKSGAGPELTVTFWKGMVGQHVRMPSETANLIRNSYLGVGGGAESKLGWTIYEGYSD